MTMPVDPWEATADEIARHSGAFAAVNALLARCAKAEAALVALVRRRDLGGDEPALLSDLVTLIDEARNDLPQAKDT
jgi:hypothetical protein